MIDISPIIGALIALLITIACVKLWPIVKAAIPPSALVLLSKIAEIAVNAVEAEYSGDEGSAKREYAFKRIDEAIKPVIVCLEKIGFTIEAKHIYDAIEAAWYKMNIEQIRAGVKDPPDLVY